MSKQLNLFGEKACIATKSYVLYKSPTPGYECTARHYLRAIWNRGQSTKKILWRRPKVHGNLKVMRKTRRRYFKGRNFRGQKLSRFSRFWSFFAKVYAFGNFKTAKRESFSREIIDIFKNAKVFSREKKTFFPSKFKAPP